MSQKPTTALNVPEHPYCSDYYRWMDEAEVKRMKENEYRDEDIDSSTGFFKRMTDGPLPNEDTPEISLEEFEDIFSGCKFLY